jgi:hypothetical protein
MPCGKHCLPDQTGAQFRWHVHPISTSLMERKMQRKSSLPGTSLRFARRASGWRRHLAGVFRAVPQPLFASALPLLSHPGISRSGILSSPGHRPALRAHLIRTLSELQAPPLVLALADRCRRRSIVNFVANRGKRGLDWNGEPYTLYLAPSVASAHGGIVPGALEHGQSGILRESGIRRGQLAEPKDGSRLRVSKSTP